MSAGRFSKKNGAIFDPIEYANDNYRSSQVRQLRSDFYNPYRKPIRSPNLLTNRLERTFGKRIVDATAKQVARRAPLALAGPLGDILALGLVGYDIWNLANELSRNAHPPGYGQPGVADPSQWSSSWGDPMDPSRADSTTTRNWAAEGWTNINPQGLYLTDQYHSFPQVLNFTPPDDDLSLINDTATWGTWATARAPWQGAGQTTDIALDANAYDFLDGVGYTFEEVWTGPETLPLWYPTDLPFDWTEPDPNMKRDLFPDGLNESDRERNPAPRPKPVTRPKRPARRTRERKAKTAIGTMLKILDIISETAEFVGAFYDALPEQTKRDWEQKYAGGHWVKIKGKYKWILKSRGLLDNAGQYGIDGADWKARALWHNWHKVDIEQAFKNVIANEFQDRILGMYQRNLPKNIGHVADGGSMGINELITNFTDTIGLT